MNKRRIDINELKKSASRGKKIRSITVKYDTVLAYFKHKDAKESKVFHISFTPLIHDLLEQLNHTELLQKLTIESPLPLKEIPPLGPTLKLDNFELKALSKEYPLKQICECLYVENNNKRFLSIQRNKLTSFFKHLRHIYADFCSCARENIIIQSPQLKLFYESFKTHWNKSEEKGRLNPLERLEKKICRSLYFLGILIENNILDAIETAQRRKKEDNQECGTRSEHPRNQKGSGPQPSTNPSFDSLDPSNPSVRLKSETSGEESFPLPLRSKLSQTSKKSERVFSRSRYNLWDKAEIRNLRFTLGGQVSESVELEVSRQEVNFLTNDVENILIDQAFKMQKFTDSCVRNEMPYGCVSMYGNYNGYGSTYSGYNQSYGWYGNYQQGQALFQPTPVSSQPTYMANEYHAGDSNQLNQLKRSLGCLNLVQTRKKDKDRYQ